MDMITFARLFLNPARISSIYFGFAGYQGRYRREATATYRKQNAASTIKTILRTLGLTYTRCRMPLGVHVAKSRNDY